MVRSNPVFWKRPFANLTWISLATGLSLSAVSARGHAFEEAADWGAGEVYGAQHPRAALRVRAHIGGFVCPMQLDTGANAAVIWHDWNDRRASPIAPARTTTIRKARPG
jgi:hypothetical protein